MSYKVLSRKWRPKKFDQVLGQDHITKVLQNAIKINRVSHSYLFSGPRGVGKTTIARILASELNSTKDIKSSLDILELDGASNRGIDEIRDLKDSVQYVPTSEKYKIFIIDEAHMLTKEAFNALLKTLEEPPSHVIFILATTEYQKIPSTISSRCQKYDFKRLSQLDILSHLNFIANQEQAKFDNNALDTIAIQADGSLRDALSLLDKIITLSDGIISKELVENVLGVVNNQIYLDILKSINERNLGKSIRTVEFVLESGISPNNFIDGFVHFARNCIYYLSVSKKSIDMNPKLLAFLDENKKYILKILVTIMNESIDTLNSKKILNHIELENMMYKFFDLDKLTIDDDNTKEEHKPIDLVNKDGTAKNDSKSQPKEALEQNLSQRHKKIDIKSIFLKILKDIENENIRLFLAMEKLEVSEADNSILVFNFKKLGKLEEKIVKDNIDYIKDLIQVNIKGVISIKFLEPEIVDKSENDQYDARTNIVSKKNHEPEKSEFEEHPLVDIAINDFNGKILK